MVEGKGFGPSASRLSAYFAEISRRQTALECPLEPFRLPIRPHFADRGYNRLEQLGRPVVEEASVLSFATLANLHTPTVPRSLVPAPGLSVSVNPSPGIQ